MAAVPPDRGPHLVTTTPLMTRLRERVRALEPRIAAVAADDAATRRALYAELEIARMHLEREYCESDVRETLRGKDANNDEVYHAAQQSAHWHWRSTDECRRLAELARTLAVRPAPRRYTVEMLLRFACMWLYIVLVTPVVFLLTPVRVLHPLLRRVGVRNNALPMDVVAAWYGRLICALAGVHVVWQQHEKLIRDDSMLLLSSHQSNIDAFLLQSYAGVHFKFVSKTSVLFLPFIGWFAWALGTIAISRSNLAAAMRSYQRAARVMRQWRRPVVVYPEGTRSTTGLLLEFKKGPFHLAREVAADRARALAEQRKKSDDDTTTTTTRRFARVQPLVVFGAWELMPPSQLLSRPGVVVGRFLDPIAVDEGGIVEPTPPRTSSPSLASLLAELPASAARARTRADVGAVSDYVRTRMLVAMAEPPATMPVRSSRMVAMEVLAFGVLFGWAAVLVCVVRGGSCW